MNPIFPGPLSRETVFTIYNVFICRGSGPRFYKELLSPKKNVWERKGVIL